MISYADDAGDFRFDIKWKALNESGKEVSIFVDTKNYSQASNMFKDLRQFKAYLGSIDNFDQMYYIQQGGRGVTQQQIINRLQSAISSDAKTVFDAKPSLWKGIGITGSSDLKIIAENKGLNNYFDFTKTILITK